ncbi:MAG: carbohydrate-binding family 9-like protein [Deltaproteobacteria bacterium]|nr:carbohydrate-binding family 9-like protein [Deltaproteobacteria bacterium]
MRRGLLLLSCLACQQKPMEAPAGARLGSPPKLAFPSTASLIERAGRGRARYLGFDVEGPVTPGGTIVLKHVFECQQPFLGDYAVHVALAANQEDLTVADHQPLEGKVPTSRWAKGELWVDTHSVRIPAGAPARVEVLVALFTGDLRLTVEAPPGGSDGQDRIKAGTLSVVGGALDLPEVEVPRATSAVSPDGRLDEPAWAAAPVLTFSDSLGRGGAPQHPTKLRLLWDDSALYVGFESIDPDISDPYKNRDDPIYEHETVEVFLMPNRAPPDLGPYLELQASPRGVIFDAAFTARRQGMDTRFDATQTVGAQIDGTIDRAGDVDRGWVSEWVVPWKGLRGVTASPKAGDIWRMNAFRIDKTQKGGGYDGEYTAWSPPKVGDFHATDRFGSLKFVTTATSAR